MDKINDNEPAFPSHSSMGEVNSQGMTLRDYFAGQALMGMLADHTGIPIPQRYADIAYELADAMLAERNK